MTNASEARNTSIPASTSQLPLPHYLLDEQSASLAEFIAAERRHATRWWTHLNDIAVVLLEHKVGSLALEFRSKGTALFGHLTPRSGEHSRLNGCPVSLDHYKSTPELYIRDSEDEVSLTLVKPSSSA